METYVKGKDLEMKSFEGETIVLNPKEGDFFKLNEVGAFILKNLNGKNSKAELVKKITAKFEVKKEKAEKDVQIFIKELEKRKLIKAK